MNKIIECVQGLSEVPNMHLTPMYIGGPSRGTIVWRDGLTYWWADMGTRVLSTRGRAVLAQGGIRTPRNPIPRGLPFGSSGVGFGSLWLVGSSPEDDDWVRIGDLSILWDSDMG